MWTYYVRRKCIQNVKQRGLRKFVRVKNVFEKVLVWKMKFSTREQLEVHKNSVFYNSNNTATGKQSDFQNKKKLV